MKATKLIKLLQSAVKEHGENLDVFIQEKNIINQVFEIDDNSEVDTVWIYEKEIAKYPKELIHVDNVEDEVGYLTSFLIKRGQIVDEGE